MALHRTHSSIFVLSCPELDPSIPIHITLCWIVLPRPANNVLFNATQVLLVFFAVRTHSWIMFTSWKGSGPFLLSYFPADGLQPVDPQPVLVHGVFPPQVRDFVFPFIELAEVPVGPFVQPVEVLLMAAQPSCVSALSQLCIFFAEDTLCPVV